MRGCSPRVGQPSPERAMTLEAILAREQRHNMASTGQLLDGKIHAYWTDANSTGYLLEHFGTLDLPNTTPNEINEHQSDVANRKEMTVKGGYDDATISVLFNSTNYFKMLAAKKSGGLGTLTYLCGGAATGGLQQDGGNVALQYSAQVSAVNGGSADVDDMIESFDVTFAIKGLLGTAGSDGTQVYDADITNPAAPTVSAVTGD